MTFPGFVAFAEEYLALRRGLGFALTTQGRLLLDFARSQDRNSFTHLTLDSAVSWAQSSGRGGLSNAARRLTIVRGFARFCTGRDPATEVPPLCFFGSSYQRKSPHIYSDVEVSELLRIAADIRPRNGLRPHTYTTLFALLAATGLRVSEALHLSCSDVDLDQGLLTIREGKFRKSRFVPLHQSALEPLRRYAEHRDKCNNVPKSDFFFRAERSPNLTLNAVESTFWRLRKELHWTADGRTRIPRIHDFRHSFVVRRMLAWYKEGVDVDRKISVLATYLGHTQATETYWYFTAVPELMAVVGHRFERFANCSRGDVL